MEINAHKANVKHFQTKLETDLKETQQSLIQEMKTHGLLADINFAMKNPDERQMTLNNLMKPIETTLQDCFDKTREQIEEMAQNKNYFAMSLKCFFIELSNNHPDLLELMCHNYVHQWVNKEVTTKPKVSTKYLIEEKLEYIKKQKEAIKQNEESFAQLENLSKSKTEDDREAISAPDSTRKRLNRSMHVPKKTEDLENESSESPKKKPGYLAATLAGLARIEDRTRKAAANKSMTDSAKQAWRPNSYKDDTLENDHRRNIGSKSNAKSTKNSDLFGIADMTEEEVINRFGKRSMSVSKHRQNDHFGNKNPKYSMFICGD